MSFVPSFGRIEDLAATEKVFSQQSDPMIRTAAASILSAVDDGKDVDLCELYEAATGRKWNSRNQNPRGFCVGFGNAKISTLAMAMMAIAGEISWPGADVAIEPVYGGMRYEVGYQTYGSSLYRGGDGGVGSYAVEWLTKWGVLLMQPYDTVDFTNYSLDRCDKYGRSGVPNELEPTARIHPIQKAALLQNADEAWALIGELHPVVHCSDQGFSMSRRADGTCDDNDEWPHCAGWSGRFTLPNGDKVLRYENSWNGDESGRGYLGSPITVPGKYGPIKLNGNQFLVPLDVVNRMIRSGRETYALTGPAGFTKRRSLLLI